MKDRQSYINGKSYIITGELNLDKTRKFGDVKATVGKPNQIISSIVVWVDAECAVRISRARKKQSIGLDMIDFLAGRDNVDLLFSEILLKRDHSYTLGGHAANGGNTNFFPEFIRCPIVISAGGYPGVLRYSITVVNKEVSDAELHGHQLPEGSVYNVKIEEEKV